MKNLLPLCILICLLTGCVRPQNAAQATENSTSPVTSEPTAPVEVQNTEQMEAPDEDFYSVCTNFSKTEVEQFAKEVRDMILTRNWADLAERVCFPITMVGVTYEDKAAFLNAPFDDLLNPDAIATLETEDCTDMFCNFSGIMLGNGEVWISEILNEDFSSDGLWVIGLHILKSE